ncbi:MAG: dehydrogenase [Desulfobacterales bacterium SG8_35_2]|jgi:SagB-type dehydrogenase family enzyme|nr:MAG: dehydrogenase [Desulfobacterales bacterium SG8_35_2]
MDDLKNSLGFRYLQETKFDEQTLRHQPRLLIAPAPPYKQYADAEKVKLPTDWKLDTSLQEVLQFRRSCRRYTDTPLSMENLAMLLWASQGLSGRAGNFYFRTAPSAGALYPVETYLSIQNVEALAAGLYHFHPAEFCLQRLRDGFAGKKVADAALGQNFMAKAGVVFIWSAILRRNFSKYGHRGLRYIMMDAGHICQNLLLAAQSLALGACPVAAFYDDQINALLGFDGEEESVIYLAAVGAKE